LIRGVYTTFIEIGDETFPTKDEPRYDYSSIGEQVENIYKGVGFVGEEEEEEAIDT
jgi:hypothetical protein